MRTSYDEAVRHFYGKAFGGKDECFYAFMLSQMKVSFDSDSPFVAGVAYAKGRINLNINPLLFNERPIEDRKAILKHECLHVTSKHFMRLKGRDVAIANKAMDVAINQFIPEIPSDAYTLRSLRNDYPDMDFKEKDSFENYYYQIMQSEHKAPDMPDFDGHDFGEVCEDEIPAYASIVSMIVSDSLQKARSTGSVSEDLEEAIKLLMPKKPSIDWQKYISKKLDYALRHKTEYIKRGRDRRFPKRLDLSGKRKTGIVLNVAVVVDVSGSMDNDDIVIGMCDIIYACKKHEAKVSIVQCDTEIKEIDVFNWRKMNFDRKGSGGTYLYPAIEYLNEKEITYDLVVVITDGGLSENKWPEPPKCEVVFLLVQQYGLPLDLSNFKKKPLVVRLRG